MYAKQRTYQMYMEYSELTDEEILTNMLLILNCSQEVV